MSPENVQEEVAEPELRSARVSGLTRNPRCSPSPDRYSPAQGVEPPSSNAVRDSLVAFKFGGSSLLGAERMRHAAGLVRPVAKESLVVVIVSAMKGVTDRLLAVAQALADRDNLRARAEAEGVLRLHFDVLRELLPVDEDRAQVARDLDSLGQDLLHEIPAQGCLSATPELFDRLASFGERLSARLFAAALQNSGVPAVPVSSSEFVLTCDNFRDAKPHLEQTRQRGREVLLPLLADRVVPVVTGFVGATRDGRITANPHESAEAQLLHDLSYDDAHALAAKGARVLHPHVLPLAAETQMTVWVRNTFKPHVRGTRIGSHPASSDSAAQAGGAA